MDPTVVTLRISNKFYFEEHVLLINIDYKLTKRMFTRRYLFARLVSCVHTCHVSHILKKNVNRHARSGITQLPTCTFVF